MPPTSHIDFLRLALALKKIKRRGWIQHDIPSTRVESVADHSFGVALCALACADARADDEPFDRSRAIAMALVHDLAEVVVGDITPRDGVSDGEKHEREREAFAALSDALGGDVGRELEDLFLEYEQGTSAEAKFVKDMDKLEMILQAEAYESEGACERGALESFFAGVEGRWKTDVGRALASDVVERRENAKVE